MGDILKIGQWLASFKDKRVRESMKRAAMEMPVQRFCESVGRDAFANILFNTLHISLAKGYRRPESVADLFVNMGSAADFRLKYVAAGGEFGDLETIEEHKPYPLETFGDQKASYQVVKRGKMFAVSMEARVNDQLGELSRTARKFGNSAFRTKERFVLKTNIEDNPTMTYDSKALFHADHNNDVSAGTGFTRAALITALTKFVRQTGIGGEEIAVIPRTLLVKPEDFPAALREVKSALQIQEQADTVNDAAATFRGSNNEIALMGWIRNVVTSPMIGASSNAFYLAADPAEMDMMALDFLNGQREPEVLTEAAQSGAAFEYEIERTKVRHIYGGAWTDHRGIVRAGA